VILVDTNVVVWLAFDQDQISPKARAAINDARNQGDGLAISDITLLELSKLVNKGRVGVFLRREEIRALMVESPDVSLRRGAGVLRLSQRLQLLEMMRNSFESAQTEAAAAKARTQAYRRIAPRGARTRWPALPGLRQSVQSPGSPPPPAQPLGE